MLSTRVRRHLQETLGCAATTKSVLGIGISVNGLVDTFTGTVIESTNLAWEDFPLLKRLNGKWVDLKGRLGALDVLSRAETGDATAIQIIKSSAKHIGLAIGTRYLLDSEAWKSGLAMAFAAE